MIGSMECEIFSILPKDVTSVSVTGYNVEHKDVSVDFNGLFQTGQTDIFASYITERCLSHVLGGRNVAHFLVDSTIDQFYLLCKEVISTSLEECTSCKVSGYSISNDCRCLLSGSLQSLPFTGGWGTSPFKNNFFEDVKSVEAFDSRIFTEIRENLPGSYDVVCLNVGFEIIPATGSNITKLFPELSIIMIRSDNMYVSKMISDISNISDKVSERIISTSLAANTVGFYLDGNFQCSATFNCRTLLNLKSQLSLARSMGKIKSFPIVNDIYSKWLIAKISSPFKEKDLVDSSVVKSMKNDLQSMAKDNVRLMNENENLHKQLDSLGVEMNNILGSKQMLSDEVRQKLSNEQEIYNKFTEMAVEKVKIKDDSEIKRYELMNKIFSLENDLLNAQINAEEWKAKHDKIESENCQLQDLKDDLQSEYISMKTNHHGVVSKQTGLERKCEQLSLELVQLHMEYDESCKMRGINPLRSPSTTPLPEIKRSNSYTGPKTVEDFKIVLFEQERASKTEKDKLLRELVDLRTQIGDLNKFKMKQAQQKELLQHSLKLQGINETHSRKITALEDKLYQEVTNKEEILNKHNRLTVNHNATSLLNNKLKSENVHLRRKLQNAIEEYRARLDSYIKDTEKFLNRKNATAQSQSHLSKMIDEYRKSYIEREADLLEDVNSTKSDLLDTLEKYHKVEHDYAQVSNAKVVHGELTRLRKENKANAEALKEGKIVPIEKVCDQGIRDKLNDQEISLLV